MMFTLDAALFLAINHIPHIPLLISIASLFSGIGPISFVTFGLVVALMFFIETKNHWFFLPISLSGILSYLVSEVVLKEFFQRPRPFTAMSDALVVVRYTDWSFPSTHTTVAFASAYILSRFLPRHTLLLFFLAFCVGFSRIYVGAHYPSDVFCGAVLGWGIGFFVWRGTMVLKLIKHKALG